MSIRYANLKKSKLINVNLSFANLEAANLETIHLTGTNFYDDVNIKGVRINGAYCKYSKPLKV
jgi:uncharacterized protein YjbI with pentapeptide repeats